MFAIDRRKKILIVKNGSVVTRHLRFEGKVLAGLNTIFWGNVEAEEVCLSKGCKVRGVIVCKKAVIGAYTVFNRIEAEDFVLIQSGCVGKEVIAKNVKIVNGSRIDFVKADEGITIDGDSKLGKLDARRILAVRDSST